MNNPETEYPFLRWPVRSVLNLSGIYKQNQDNCQLFHLPTRTKLPEKEQAASNFSTYVVSYFNLHDNHIFDIEKEKKIA
jgi:hypothetical protein